MKIIKSIILISAISGIAFSSQIASANSPEVQKVAKHIKSVGQVKEEIREIISSCQESGCSGYGIHSLGMRICELTQALDIKVNGKISGKRLSNRQTIPISKSDISLMRMILSQCQWQVYHAHNDPPDFTYRPTAKMRQKINRQFRIPV
ncbi:hypothetical protein DSM106972_096570 [Dulcicalothrix desertica PCC 7102]|uniref:Uncharacterized protein n=1 Tax=Dulcicalothrix desertica PCC 7102 TaxID=232991 RepID=A0A3S1CJ25_9CYAN|nr:hypothetical protein [Dulcicalothrix desertica]RUS93301.1 hypothetical protein DSM106972_096570 [Dulcicalothrix desertica PCC 7102]TWH62759.1 hypothetical protein CAL7102_00282 [Dulcicalothrix desertica PCC 7102]